MVLYSSTVFSKFTLFAIITFRKNKNLITARKLYFDT